MIARFRLLLPLTIHVLRGEALPPQDLPFGDAVARVYPPFQSVLGAADKDAESALPLQTMIERLEPADPQGASQIRIDGAEAVAADVLTIDVRKPDFTRTPGSDDPPIERVFGLVNDFLVRLRDLGHAASVRPLDHKVSCWRIDFLSDEGARLPRTPPLVRRRVTGALVFRSNGLTRATWEAAWASPRAKPKEASVLLREASELLPVEPGVAILLAALAVEATLRRVLDALAAEKLPSELWAWISDRPGHEPSPKERAALLAAVGPRALRDDVDLIPVFLTLTDARAGFEKLGWAGLGDSAAPARAAELVAGAGRIVEWLEAAVGSAEPKPRPEAPSKAEYVKPFTIPPPG